MNDANPSPTGSERILVDTFGFCDCGQAGWWYSGDPVRHPKCGKPKKCWRCIEAETAGQEASGGR